ncbi:helix-turn-helix domain-containing protein [Rhodoferax sp.]|uniref:helix-turn-helix domain-containing protein n=1 Tax=Rhodoferax sp. TaxID=50421 RepID=UPI002743F829|nr:XRE family transcriptional regulator [Rhodoferax sp.]
MATRPSKAANASSAEPPRVGDTLAALRQQQSLSLDELSRRAGVSKSMLSQIERAQANPTVAVVWRLANALGVPMGDLLGNTPAPSAPVIDLVAVHATPSLRSPDGLCELRILGPIDLAGQFEWYHLSLQVGSALESQAHEDGTREHLTAVSGTLEVRSGDEKQRLKIGETARYAADRPHSIRNLGKTAASAWLVVVHVA